MDIGDVLVHTDTGAQYRQLAGLTGRDPEQVRRLVAQSGLAVRLEHGQLSEPEFVAALRVVLGHRLTAAQVRHCWAAELVGVDPVVVAAAAPWADRQRLVLASNTNCLHWPPARDLLAQAGITAPAYLSFAVGCTKPDPRFFHGLIGADPPRYAGAAYVDDRADNVAAAIQSGLDGWLHRDPTETAERITALLS